MQKIKDFLSKLSKMRLFSPAERQGIDVRAKRNPDAGVTLASASWDRHQDATKILNKTAAGPLDSGTFDLLQRMEMAVKEIERLRDREKAAKQKQRNRTRRGASGTSQSHNGFGGQKLTPVFQEASHNNSSNPQPPAEDLMPRPELADYAVGHSPSGRYWDGKRWVEPLFESPTHSHTRDDHQPLTSWKEPEPAWTPPEPTTPPAWRPPEPDHPVSTHAWRPSEPDPAPAWKPAEPDPAPPPPPPSWNT